MEPTEKPRYFINSLSRGLAILSSFLNAEQGYTLTEVSTLNHINQATAIRHLYTLKELGYISHDPLTKKYTLTPKIYSFAVTFLRKMDLRTRLMPFMIDIRKKFDIATQCSILNHTEIIFLERLRSSNFVELDFTIGSRAPVYCTSQGKVILAFLDENQAAEIIKDINFVAYTQNTITDKKTFLNELKLIKTRGFSTSNQELILGLKSYAGPVFKSGKVEGAFGVTFHINVERDENWSKRLIECVKKAAQKASI